MWLPNLSFRVVSPKLPNGPHVVSDLINPMRQTWDVDKVKQCFIPLEVDEILSIPLTDLNVIDDLS